jgi:guanosine-3',5'-bis(diphosphate) 3'-pyrophosphohydrolase
MTHKILPWHRPLLDPGIVATLERAIEIAARAHTSQADKAGQPYIIHPLRVMLRVTTKEEMIAAVLHDVVEDTPVSLEDLRREGFSEQVLAAVEALTKREGETRLEAAKRAATDPIARAVKLADNAENMDLSRIPNPTEKDLSRVEEYRAVRKLLVAEENTYESVDNASQMFGLPIDQEVCVTLRGGRAPELLGVLQLDDRRLFLSKEEDSNLALRIGEAVFRRHEIESCRIVDQKT